MPCLYPADITSLRSRNIATPPTSPQVLSSSEDSLSEEQVDSSTGNSSFSLTEPSDEPMSNPSLEVNVTPNYRDRQPRPTMYGRRRPASRERNFNWEIYPRRETHQRTGRQYGNTRRRETSIRYLPMLESDRTPNYAELATTTWTQLAWNESAQFIGVSLAAASLIGPGARQVLTPTLKVTLHLISRSSYKVLVRI